ncbi:hypothetical protein CR513_21670, partial [Mucuna pruriens]
MEEEAKLIRQQQRRMNLTILDMVKKEVTKLLVVGIIYPISDSQWVSLVHVVPKKSEITVMKNQHDKLEPMRIQNNLRVYIDYRRSSFYRRLIKNFNKLTLPLSKLLQKDVEFKFDQPCIEAFQELKNRLTSAPILQAPN